VNHWWRAYNEAVNDPKLQLISDALFRAWFNLMCIASANDGALPALKDVAFTLRLAPAKAAQILAQLHAAGLLDKTETGFAPHNWSGRQYKSDVSTDRVKRFRNGHRNVSSGVTKTVSETPPDTDTDTDTEALPTVAQRAPKKRPQKLPDSWVPSEKAYQIAEQFGQNVQVIEQIFRDYIASSGKLYADHDAAFNNFIRNQSNFNRGGNNGKPQSKSSGSLLDAIDRELAKTELSEEFDPALSANSILRIPQRSIR
jgi:hypothetical protein